jgi:hypothetical protein
MPSTLRTHTDADDRCADALRRDERALTSFLSRYESLYQRPALTERMLDQPV